MKTITAVQCDACGKLIDANKTFLVAKIATLNHHSGDREVTKTHITDGAFCDAECFTQLVLRQFGMDR